MMTTLAWAFLGAACVFALIWGFLGYVEHPNRYGGMHWREGTAAVLTFILFILYREESDIGFAWVLVSLLLVVALQLAGRSIARHWTERRAEAA